jgi:hypothetical protein
VVVTRHRAVDQRCCLGGVARLLMVVLVEPLEQPVCSGAAVRVQRVRRNVQRRGVEEVGAEHAGFDDRRLDAEGFQFGAQGLANTGDRELGGRVHADPGLALEPRAGSDVHDFAVPGGTHIRKDRPDEI